MNQHKYLRAYMAGIVIPTVVLLVIMTAFTIFRFAYNVPIPIERVIVFPMAVVPNLWGLWNMLHAALPARLHLSLGLHGALLPFLIAPLAFILVSILSFPIPPFVVHIFPVAAPAAIIAYYLVWKYLVAFLNRAVAIV